MQYTRGGMKMELKNCKNIIIKIQEVAKKIELENGK